MHLYYTFAEIAWLQRPGRRLPPSVVSAAVDPPRGGVDAGAPRPQGFLDLVPRALAPETVSFILWLALRKKKALLLPRCELSISKSSCSVFTFVSFWQLLQAKYSHIARVSVGLILHCLNLPLGSEVMHQLLVETFHSESWHDRFTGSEYIHVHLNQLIFSP